jgi:16S rRNA (guanine966-N2)-methyltransferase
MRVVSGVARGRKLLAPAGQSTRPTSDRVREATFNALISLGAVDEADVADLYAGSGAMGIEALSRGAASCTFVDDDPKAVAVVRANLEGTGLEGTVVRDDVLRWLQRTPRRFDLALLDPPYGFADDDWGQVLSVLDAEIAVLESDREVPVPAPWRVLRSKRYGGTVVSVVERP